MEERKDNFKENSAIEKVENASLTTETAPPEKGERCEEKVRDGQKRKTDKENQRTDKGRKG